MKKFNPQSLKIAYIGGGSMGWARVLMSDLALEPELGGEVCLYDIDIESAKRNEIIGNRISAHEQAKGKWHYTAVSDIGEALTEADYVIASVLPGTFEHMRSDVHLPERLGIYQPVGDTTGPGGIIRALRTVPIYSDLANAIKKYAPDAWVINYTNPMSLCMRALYNEFPQIKAFGCCHEVFGTQALLAAMMSRETGADMQRGDISVNVMGLNHFTWFDKAAAGSEDVIPVYAKYVDEYYNDGFASGRDETMEWVFKCKNRVKFDLYRRYGLIAAAGDRHLAEFMPGGIYLKNPETAEQWGFALTSVDWRITDRQKKAERTAQFVSGKAEPEMKPSGEEGVLLIKALCGLGDTVSNVNVPNTAGQIGNLPRDTVVETNALFSLDSVSPMTAGNLPGSLEILFAPHVENQAEVLQAALSCDMEAVVRAFGRDPLLQGRCTAAELRSLAADMIHNTLDVLPEGWS